LLLGPYVILDRVGEGGGGQVFKARHQKMNRVVALKVIRDDLVADPEVLRRFYREIEIVSQLKHPNLVHAYDAGPIDARHVRVRESLEGTDLAGRVKESGPLPAALACEFIRQAATGLEYVHQHHLVHRDVKPHNLMVSGGAATALHAPLIPYQVKVLDLGL